MNQNKKIILAVVVLVLIGAVVFGVEFFQRQSLKKQNEAALVALEPGSIPVYLNGQLISGFTPADLENLDKVSFVDAEEGKTQEGWLLKDVLSKHVDVNSLSDNALVIVSSSVREKSVELTWAEVSQEKNMVMFDLSNKGTVKLVSLLDKLDVRDEWVQDTDKIEVFSE